MRKTLKKHLYFLFNGLNKDKAIQTHLTDEEKIILHKIAKNLLPYNSIAVEIGSFLGTSSCFIANGLKNKNGILYCVDTWGNHHMDTAEHDTYESFRKNVKKYRDNIVEVRGWSSEVVDQMKNINKKFDFLFIDGDHSYEGAKLDWNLYSPMLKDAAIVAFHDTGASEGVKKLISENIKYLPQKLFETGNMQVYRFIHE